MARALGPSEKRREGLSCLPGILRARRPSRERSLSLRDPKSKMMLVLPLIFLKVI